MRWGCRDIYHFSLTKHGWKIGNMNEDAFPTRKWESSHCHVSCFGGVYITLIFQRTRYVAKWKLVGDDIHLPGQRNVPLNHDFLEEAKIRSPGYLSEKYLHQKKVSLHLGWWIMKPILGLWGRAIFFDLQMQPQYETMLEWFTWATKKNSDSYFPLYWLFNWAPIVAYYNPYISGRYNPL